MTAPWTISFAAGNDSSFSPICITHRGPRRVAVKDGKGNVGYARAKMRIDPKGTVAGWPALLVRRTLRQLRTRVQWGLPELKSIASIKAEEGRALIKGLLAEGLIEAAGRDAWKVTQAGQALSSATAARRVTRATAQKALQQFLGRVQRVNNDPYFLGKVTRVVLFGSMLKPEVEQLSDVDLAVELASKESDFDRARVKNYERVDELATQGHRFRNFLEQEGCWYREVFGFLKGESRVIALADYSVEKAFVLTVPHRFLIGQPEQIAMQSAPSTPKAAARQRRPRACPF
jgi:predicted nucleotidyltransferase